MNNRLPPIHALTAFEAAARLASFAKAAVELNITRSAVSHRIRLIENTLNAPLFERSKHGVELTPTGAAYLPRARKAVSALQELGDYNDARLQRLRITLTAPPSFSRQVLLPLLQPFLREYPDIEITLEVAMSQVDFRASAADLNIRFGVGNYEGVECQLLLREAVFAVASEHYAAELGLEVPEDLSRALLLRSRLEPWRPWFAAAGLDWSEPRSGHRFEDLSLLYSAAASGLGIALARRSLARPLLREGALVPLFGVEALSTYSYYLLYDSAARERPAVARLIDWLLDSAAKTYGDGQDSEELE